MGNSTKTPPTCTIFLLSAIIVLTIGGFGESSTTCFESERQALLKFKSGLQDPSKQLASWVGEECCEWSGVICDNGAGRHVHELVLRGPPDWWLPSLRGVINPSLLDLKHLRHLDLSMNGFLGNRIPKFLGSISSLTYLNLSRSGFEGTIPGELGNLTNLEYLDLGTDHHFSLQSKNLRWLSRLSSLKYLDLQWTNLSEAHEWLEVTNALPSLLYLRLSGCSLGYTNYSSTHNHINFTSLSNLDLSYNEFPSFPAWIFKLISLSSLDLSHGWIGGPIPEGIQNLTASLKSLDLSYSLFLNSSIPAALYRLSHLEVLKFKSCGLGSVVSSDIKNLTSIAELDLSFNELQGKLPSSMGELCSLRKLDLSSNKFNQNISQVLRIFSRCVLNNLETLDLSSNQISGHLTNQIGQFRKLTSLSLSYNPITGSIPSSLSNLTSLRDLIFKDNLFYGTLPESLGQLSMLETLDISGNSFRGILSEAHFANMTSLTTFYANGNNALTLRVSDDWKPRFRQLGDLRLSSCRLGLRFPTWLHSQESLYHLDLSNTGLSCVAPSWFGNFSSQLNYLDLSNNQMHGRFPNMLKSGSDSIVYLGFNQFEGPLPYVSSKVAVLDLSNNLFSGSISPFLCHNESDTMRLKLLDLGNNRLSGKIPDCWMEWPDLEAITLSRNKFTGTVPSSMGSLTSLSSLHLYDNNLSGIFPFIVQSFSELTTLDLGENKFTGGIPSWIGRNLSKLVILVIRSNEFTGSIPEELCGLIHLQILDLALNQLSGPIPKCFNKFEAMATQTPPFYGSNSFPKNMSLSGDGEQKMEDILVMMKGKMVQYDKTLLFVKSIDLSRNFLSGSIPEEVTSLSSLVSLNLSENLLTGTIPAKLGDMRALESIDFSVNRLSGEIPPAMASLSFLSHLNLSHNNLSGMIPLGTQLQSFSASSFDGNHLCGSPLAKKCNDGAVNPNPTSHESSEGKRWLEADGLYVSMAIGFIVGFWGEAGL